MSNKFTIKAEAVYFSYKPILRDAPVKVLDNASITFQPGNSYAIIGPNGAGKTTFLKLICGFLEPAGGKIILDEMDLNSLSRPEIARFISYVPQEHHPTFDFTVREMLMMGRSPHLNFIGLTSKKDNIMLKDISHKLELTEFLEKPYTILSGGERRRVLLGRALMQDTPALVLDELDSNLDIRHQHNFLKIVYELSKSNNKICIFTIHNPELAYYYSHQTLIISRSNKMFMHGPTPEILTATNLHTAYNFDFKQCDFYKNLK